MMLNPILDRLSDYPFPRLTRLLAGESPPDGVTPVDLSIGEPRHLVPELLARTVAAHAHLWNRYPPVEGTAEFRAAVADWLRRRYGLPERAIDADAQIIPVAGTKEALFMLAAVVADAGRRPRPAVLMPNPFYNVYLGGALLAGAEPVLLPVTRATRFLPDLDALPAGLLERTAALYLCSPANPQGMAADLDYLRRAVALARRHGFLLVLDECYAELYGDAPPPGGLEAAFELDGSLDHVVVFHSLSKRSSAAGLRSGFVAGDRRVIAAFTHLRRYGAAVQPLPLLAAATALWRDEEHVVANRALYQEKFDLAGRLLGNRYGFYRPDGGFFLWLEVGDGEAAAVRLWREAGLRVLPGGYIGRPDPASGVNPGDPYVRVALVHDPATTEAALRRFGAALEPTLPVA
ncbi:MAG TPA: aminotransferase class I/II-fold pyridoxal phosphate-dependent enzyme [Geminicoccaceae bacterium]|nr:aminotransferase class I/II-fold pyridoxal phosphate-dependent enzyme [Geminicoccaceae bacterium]